MNYEEYKQTLTTEQYKELLSNALNEKKQRLEAEIKQKQKELKKLNECSLLLRDSEAFMTGA